jgi:outer membrane protein OmpA-like peptidoglycan-associated protein
MIMNRPFRTVLAAAVLVLLSGCAGTMLEEAETTASQGNAHDRALRDAYLEQSRTEYNEGDYGNSDIFAERSMAAARGEEVPPEPIEARELPGETVAVLTAARQRLVAVLVAGAGQTKPTDAAEAQVAFDCWMEEQEENRQPDHIAECRERFETAMVSLEEPPPAAAPAAPPPAPMPQPAPGPFTVYFDFGSAELTADAQTELADVVEAAQSSPDGTIDIIGYTDLAGPEAYNQVLSERRANAVIEYLVEGGVEAIRIVGRGLGETNPVVQTDAPEQRNRRVEITFQQ